MSDGQSGGETFQCEICDKTFISKRALRGHMKYHSESERDRAKSSQS